MGWKREEIKQKEEPGERGKGGDGAKKRSFGERGVNEVPGMTQASNEAWMENIRCTSSDRDARENSFIEVSAFIHQSIIRKKQ